MPEINIIPSASIPRIPDVVIPNQTNLPITTHVTRMLPPTFDMPCATVRTDGTKNSQLFTDDPAGNVVINCAIPFYEPLQYNACLLYTSPSPRDLSTSRMPSSA